jgi:hypothetical protein
VWALREKRNRVKMEGFLAKWKSKEPMIKMDEEESCRPNRFGGP